MSKFIFRCATKWHEPDENIPTDVLSFSGIVYQGNVCKHCGCPYFEKQGKASAILAPGGGIIES